MSARPEVKVGQVWKSCDRREIGREIEVVGVGPTHATVRTIKYTYGNATLRQSRIRLDRFQAGSTGWRLLREGGAA